MSTKLAYKLPNAQSFVLPVVNNRLAEGRSAAITLNSANAKGYTVEDWPTVLGLTLTESEVNSRLVAEVTKASPAAINEPDASTGRLTRIFAAAPRPEVIEAAQFLASTDLDEKAARGFLRGIPTQAQIESSLSTETITEKENDMHYQNQPAGDRAKIRACEIRINSLEAKGGAKAKEIRYARTVAASTGKSLISTLADLNIHI